MGLTSPKFQQPVGRSAVVALKRAIQQYFADAEVDAEVFFGLKNRHRWDTSRVVIIDGIYSGESTAKPLDAGVLEAPTQKQSYNPREIASWKRPLTIAIRGVDKSAIDDEDAQTEAQEDLIEATLQAVQNAVDPELGPVGQANVEWDRMLWMAPPVQQAFGKELLLGLTLKCVFFDRAQETRVPTLGSVRGPLLSTQLSGVNASVVLAANGIAFVKIGPFVDPAWVGQGVRLSGAAAGGNNGVFLIEGVGYPGQLQIDNGSAVAPDGNNGKITWAIVAPP